MTNWLTLKRRNTPPKQRPHQQVIVYADTDGALNTIDEDGNVTAVGTGGNGGSQPVPYVGATAPADPTDGELWWDTDDTTPIDGGLTKEVTIVTVAELEDADNTPVVITTAPAAGSMLVPIQMLFSQEGGMTPWTLGTPPLVQVTTVEEWVNQSNQGTWGQSQRNPFIENGMTTIATSVLLEAYDDLSTPGADGQALAIVLTHSITGGGSRLQVTSWYATVPVPFS